MSERITDTAIANNLARELADLMPLAREAWPGARDDGWRMSLMSLTVQIYQFGSGKVGNGPALRALAAAMESLAKDNRERDARKSEAT